MQKTNLVKFKEIERLLIEAKFNPMKNPILQVIAEVGDRNYYLNRMLELIKEIQLAKFTQPEIFHRRIILLIQLAVLTGLSK